MFKKKPTAEPPRARQRVTQQPSSGSPVFSYHASRANNPDVRTRNAQPPAESRRTPRFKGAFKKLGRTHVLGILCALIVLLLLVGLNTTPKVELTGDQTGRTFLQDPSVYQKAAQKLLASSFLNANKLTIDTADISTKLEQQFPELRAVSISLPVIGRQPSLYVQAATPILVLTTQHDGQFVVDDSGRALGQVTARTKLPDDPALPIVSDQSGIEVQSGHVALPPSAAQFIAETVAQLHAQKINISSWTLTGGGNELDAQVSGAKYFAKFNLQGPARQQAGTLAATLQYLSGKHIIPAQYIDIRVGGRAYYK